MNTQKFYIPISRNKLAHFFGRGVIVPSKYLENCQEDVQNIFDDYILFSRSKFTNNTDCCIEVVLDDQESKRRIEISNNFSIFAIPLAISRVTAIYFRNKEECKNTIYSITKDNGDAFIPTRLQYIANTEESVDIIELESVECGPNPKDWSSELKKFDQLMGGFSLLKLCSTKEGVYPSGYSATLANLNRLFLPESQNYKFRGLFKEEETNSKKLKRFRELIYSEIDKNKVKDFAETEEEIKVKEQYGDIVLEDISNKKSSYILAVIASYGAFGATKKIDEFLYSFYRGTLDVGPVEQEVALCFGINKGYSTFSNQYSISDLQITIKFKLENESDYHIIESIYQNIFYDKEEFDSSDIIAHQMSASDEYYDPMIGDITASELGSKKKFRVGFFGLSKVFSQKYSMDEDSENNPKLNKNLAGLASFMINLLQVNVNSINHKITELKKSGKQLDSQFSTLKDKLESNYLSKSEINNNYASRADTISLNNTIEQHIKAVDGRFTQEIERIDNATTKSEDALSELKSEVQNNYASKAETADLKRTIEQTITAVDGRLNQEIKRIDDTLTKSEEALTELKSEVQNNYVSTTEVAQAIEKNITALDGRFTQEIERIDNASTKLEESLASTRLETQKNYETKAEIDDLKQTIESSYLSRQEVDDLMKLMVQDISKLVSGLKTQLEVSIALNNKQEEAITALNNKIADLEIRFKNLEQKSTQPITTKVSRAPSKNKVNEETESQIGDLFENDAEPLNEERVKELTKLKRDELNEIAKNYGLLHTTYRTKSDIASAIAYWEASNDYDD